jgi:DNA-binding MarR family transcriptional regulator
MGSHASDRAAIRRILDALRRVVRDLRLSARAAEGIAGVSGAQLFVLQALADAPASSLGALAERTLTDPSSVSVVVRRLVEKKLVARKPSPDDARRVGLTLTAGGRRVLARCPEPTQARILDALRRLKASELAALDLGAAALERAMGLDATAPRMFFEEAASAAPERRKRRVIDGRA